MSRSPESVGRGEAGFTLIELMIASVVLTVGLVSMAQLLTVTTLMQADARALTNASHLAQTKFDELAKLNFTTDPRVQVGGSLTADVANYNDTVTVQGVMTVRRRWLVQGGPVADTRFVTVRILNTGARQFAQRDLTTVIRQW